MRDVVIIGSGPAGLSAAVYGARAMLDVLVVEKEPMSGGQIIYTDQVDNYLGMPNISGFDMAVAFRQHAEQMGTEFVNGQVEKIQQQNTGFEISLSDGSIVRTRTVLIATGAKHRMLDVPGEQQFKGAGVSYCATCDGAFFKGRTTAVVGGGDVALGDALYLSKLCKKVYLVHRREGLRASAMLQQRLSETDNIEFLPFCEVQEIYGTECVEGIVVQNNQKGTTSKLEIAGLFVAIGMTPESSIVQGMVPCDEQGYILAGESGITGTEGIFVAGDVRQKKLRQIITAVSDGACAIHSIQEYLTAESFS